MPRTYRKHTSGRGSGKPYPVHQRRNSRPRRNVKIPIKDEGALTRHGYDIWKTERSRHIALGKAIRATSHQKVWRQLLTQVILRKNVRKGSRKALARYRFAKDSKWVVSQMTPRQRKLLTAKARKARREGR